MELGTIFWTALLVGFSGAMMPGPLLTMTIGETARRGFAAGLLLVLGHAILEITLVGLLVLGAAEFLASGRVHTAIAVVGGAFLVFMGWSMYRDAVKGRVSLQLENNNNKEESGNEKVPAGLHPVPAGILISLSNPYWSLWWATVGLTYITTSMARGVSGLVAFLSGHLLADLLWYGAVSGAVAGGRRFMSQAVYRGLIVACGIFLVGLGAYFVYSGLV
ncbi:LysE family transporter [Desulfallas sp. Bu1-1]|uniref:LysE family transporter n=1 Tax=Desulfallas sp. Bu1-1 TaxID=2787620 RepID=UPI00189F182E|nr:LysE family transporter [Desulfallas sp. Bu1-1]MBF7083459.1 LysE family transporter [Desulfallas sp. Bu1-1]